MHFTFYTIAIIIIYYYFCNTNDCSDTMTRTNITCKRYLIILTILLCGFFPPAAIAVSQDLISYYYPYTFSTSDGLSSNTTYAIAKWGGNFIWVATKQGIDMYNGNSFKHYSLFDDNIRSKYDGQHISVCSSSKDKLWAFTDSGQIYFYDENADNFRLFISLPEKYPGCYLNSIFQYEDKLYLALNGRVECIDIKNRQTIFSSLSEHKIQCLLPYKDYLLAGTDHGIYTIGKTTISSEPIKGTRQLDIQTLYADSIGNRIYIGCNGRGLWIMENGNVRQMDGSLKTTTIRAIRSIDGKNILIGSDGMGVFRISRKDNIPELLATDTGMPGILPLHTSGIYDILVDNKNIWIASYRGGLTLLRRNSGLHLIKNENSEVMSDNFAHSICEGDKGDIWIAFNAAIGNYNPSDHSFNTYLNKKSGFLAVEIDNSGYLWCGGYNSGIYRIDTQTGEYEFFPSLSGNKENDCVMTIYKDFGGDIWIGGLNFGLTQVRVRGSRFTTRQYDLKQVNALTAISKDSLLAGTTSGFRIIDKRDGNITTYLEDSSISKWTGTTVINCIEYDKRNRQIWLGTEGGGLLCYNLPDNSVIPFTTKEGLPSNYIMGMCADREGFLWITTEDAGLFIFDMQHKKIISSIINYNGLFFNEFFPNSACRLSNGNIIFGGYQGVIVLSPSSVRHKPASHRIHFTTLKIGPEKISTDSHPDILPAPLDKTNKITLPYNNRTFTLSVCTDDLYNQTSCPIYYRLTGYNEEWTALGKQYSISYSNLPPGKYTLQIKEDNSESNAGITRDLKIEVEQKLWFRWYFLLLYICIAGGLVYWGFITYKSRMEEVQSKEKIRFFINVAHDIRTPLTLIASPLNKMEQLMKGNSSVENEERYLLNTAKSNVDHLLGTINQLMDFDKLNSSATALHRKPVNLQDLVKQSEISYANTAKEKGLAFHVNIHPGDYYVYADPVMLNRILDNLLSNALKYTREGEIRIDLRTNGKKAVVEIHDTGIGISPASAKKIFRQYHRGDNAVNQRISGSGIGLFFTNEITKQMGGKLSFTSKLGAGSTFFLQLPLIQAPLTDFLTNATPESKEPLQLKQHSTHKENILIVEDNAEFRQYLVHILSEQYNTFEATSANQALQILPGQNFDLIISDILMPGINGNEFCKYVKTHIETSHIPVILITASTDKHVMTDGLNWGADDYITKPLDMDILVLKIHNLFNNRKKLHAYYLSKMQLKREEEKPLKNTPEQNSLDDAFLRKVSQIITDNLSNADFSVNDLCGKMAMSRTLLYEKIHKLLGMAPNDLIRNIRMKQARVWLEESDESVTDIAFKCGYQDVRYFSTAFKKHFGISPSKIRTGGDSKAPVGSESQK